MIENYRGRRRVHLIAAVWIVLCMGYIVAGMMLAPFHGDEATQIYMSRDYAYQFLQRDLSLVRYHEPPISAQEQDLRLLNGTVNKYVIGLAWHIGGFDMRDLNQQWDWGADWEYNAATGHFPSDALLGVSRIPSTVLLALGVIPMFIIGCSAGGWRGALIATGLYALHPALLLNGRRAMMEGSLLAGMLFTVVAGMAFIRTRSLLAAAALGAAAGLSLASKHTAVFTVAIVHSVCAAHGLWLLLMRRDHGRVLALSAASMIAACGVFLALNPAWWDDPIARAGDVLERRDELLGSQTTFFGGYATFNERVIGLFEQAFIAAPQYFEVENWDRFAPITEQIRLYDSSALRGTTVFDAPLGGGMLLVMAAVGAWRLIAERRRHRWVFVLIGAWAVGMIIVSLIVTPLGWQRYYLPAIAGIIVLASVGLAWAWHTVNRIRHARTSV